MTEKEMVLRNLEVFGTPEGRTTGYVFARPDVIEDEVESDEDVWQAWTSDPNNLM